MASEKPPEWLPDGWLMELRTRRDGRVERVYTSPVSGHTFRSKSEVLHYLNFEKVEGCQSQSTISGYNNHLEHDNPQTMAQGDSPLWLPQGWILEIKTRNSGKTAGRKFKCYFDPSTGSRFYSKLAVFRFLEGGQASTVKRRISRGSKPGHMPTQNRKETSKLNITGNSDSPDNDVQAQIESSPDGLPPGWTKEIRYRRNASGLRKDPPPISARSLERPEAAARRRLFTSPPSSSNNIVGLPAEDLSFQNTDPGTPQRVEGPALSLATIKDANNKKESHGQAENPNEVHIDHDCDLKLQSKGKLEQAEVAEKLSAPFSNDNLSVLSDKDSFKQVHMNTRESETLLSPESRQGELLHPANSAEAIRTSTPSKRRHVKKHAVRRPSTKNVTDEDEPGKVDDALQDVAAKADDSSNRMLLQQSVKDNQPSGESTDVANCTILYSANEMPSELAGMPCEKVDKRTDMLVTGRLSEQADVKHSDASLERQLPEKMDRRQIDTPNKKPKSGGTISGKSTRKRKAASALSRDNTMTRHITQSNAIVSMNAPFKDENSSLTPRRSSKRLAGLEPGLTANIDVSYRSLRKMRKESKSNMAVNQMDQLTSKVPDNNDTLLEQSIKGPRKTKGQAPISLDPEHEEEHPESVENDAKNKQSSGLLSAMDTCRKAEGKEPVSVEPNPEHEHPAAAQTDGARRERSFTSSFGDALLDPCIEFAFKTLTGDIPLFEDSLNIQDYFQQQINPTLNPSAALNAPTQVDCLNDSYGMSVKVQQERCRKHMDRASRDGQL